MKYFHISAEVDLKNEPSWLKEFRMKFDSPYAHHITLKNPTQIAERDVEKLKDELGSIIKEFDLGSQPVDLVFNRLNFNRTSSGECIMVRSDGDDRLSKLQKQIHESFSRYGRHAKPEYEKYEKNFDPHLTIARHLDGRQLEEAKRSLDNQIELEGVLSRITLTVVDQFDDEKWTDENNKSHYHLSAQP